MNPNVLLYYNSDKTKFVVLVSYGFGAGWSTWNKPEYAYDARIIQYWEDHRDDEQWRDHLNRFKVEDTSSAKELTAFIQSLGYDDTPYYGGLLDCELEWVPVGVNWRITEYDGAEKLELENQQSWW